MRPCISSSQTMLRITGRILIWDFLNPIFSLESTGTKVEIVVLVRFIGITIDPTFSTFHVLSMKRLAAFAEYAATAEHQVKADWALIPDGEYYLSENKKGFGTVSGTMWVENGAFIVKQGSVCGPTRDGWVPEARRTAPIKNNILQADVSTNSPSTAAWIILGRPNSGWVHWKDKNGNPIDTYRKKED